MIYSKLANRWYQLTSMGWELVNFKSQMDAKRFKYLHTMRERTPDEDGKQRLLAHMQSMHW